MATRELVFDILAIDRASAVFDRLAGKADFAGGAIGKAFLGAGLAIGAMAVDSIKNAAEMQQKMVKLTSTAGETSSGMQVAWAGIDRMAGQVGYSVQDLGDAMYYVESGSYHGAAGLKVLQAAAEGAKVENANVVEVAHAVTGAMRDYGMSADQAATVTNAMNVAVGHGMMTFNDLAEAFPKIGSRAKSANVTLEETVSALARMTADGLPATVAATFLGQTIGQLAAPTAKARTEMAGLGINATTLSQTLTSGNGHGLGDAIKMIYDGITNHLTPAGLVAVDTFKKSTGSASDYQKMLANLPPSMQTNVQALATMAGGVKGFQGLIMLGQDGLKGYKQTLDSVNASVKQGGQTIDGFAAEQKTLKGNIDDLKGAWSGLSDQLGQKMLPAVTEVAKHLTDMLQWAGDHKDIVISLATGVGVVVGALKAWSIIQAVLDAELIANPIGLVIMAIGALVTGLVYAYQHSQTFRDITNAAFHDIGAVATWLWNDAIKPFINYTLGGFIALTGAVATLFDALGHVPGFGWAKTAADAMWGAANAAQGISDKLNGIHSPPPVTVTINEVHNIVDIAKQIYTGTGGNTADPTLGGLLPASGHNAVGTNFWRGGETWVGENGPERINLPRGARITNTNDARSQGMLGSGGDGLTVNIENYNEAQGSPESFFRGVAFLARTSAAGYAS